MLNPQLCFCFSVCLQDNRSTLVSGNKIHNFQKSDYQFRYDPVILDFKRVFLLNGAFLTQPLGNLMVPVLKFSLFPNCQVYFSQVQFLSPKLRVSAAFHSHTCPTYTALTIYEFHTLSLSLLPFSVSPAVFFFFHSHSHCPSIVKASTLLGTYINNEQKFMGVCATKEDPSFFVYLF